MRACDEIWTDSTTFKTASVRLGYDRLSYVSFVRARLCEVRLFAFRSLVFFNLDRICRDNFKLVGLAVRIVRCGGATQARV